MKRISIYELKIKYFALKYSKLLLSVTIDLIGMSSLAAPGAGDISDIIWAFIHIAILKWMFTEHDLYSWPFWEDFIHAAGNVKGIYKSWSFWEELFPFSDIVPSACLSWYKHHYTESNTFRKYVERKESKYFIEY